MVAVHLGELNGHVRLAKLDLPVVLRSGPYDVDGIKRRSKRLEPVEVFDFIPSEGVRTVTLSDGSSISDLLRGLRGLVFVARGSLRITGDGVDYSLRRGDVVLIDTALSDRAITAERDTALIFIELAEGVMGPCDEPVEEQSAPQSSEDGKYLGMFSDSDELSYLEDFDSLFPDRRDEWSDSHQVARLYFGLFAPDGFVDWHPEVEYNLALVLQGALELQVSLDKRIERFHPGDGFLAGDLTGAHTTRFVGTTMLAIAFLEADQLWDRPGNGARRDAAVTTPQA